MRDIGERLARTILALALAISMHRFFVSLCLIVLTLICSPRRAVANPIDYSVVLNAADFGNLAQVDVACFPDSSCGPSAATNSFRFLEKTYPATYGGKLILNPHSFDYNNDGVVDAYDSLLHTAGDLITNFMNTTANGTLRNDFYTGKRNYIEGKAAGTTVYEVMDDPQLNTLDFNWTTNLPAIYQGKKPTPQFLSANLKSGEDLEILLTRDNGTRLTYGHYVTVTKLQWNDKDGSGTISVPDGPATISYIDPAGDNGPPPDRGGVERTRTLQQRANGLLFFTDSNGVQTDIRFAVKESQKPPKSVVKGASVTGPSTRSVSFDAATGALSLSPFELTAAYIANGLGFLDVDRIDPEFVGDPILGATLSVSPFYFGQTFPDGSVAFGGFDGVVTISKGSDVFLTAFVPTLMFDPALVTPFYAPLQILSLNTSLGSAFIGQMQSRLADPNELPFDLFIAPDGDFLRATNHFTVSANMGVNAGIAQNGHVPEPSTLTLLGIGAASMLGYAWRRRQ